MAFGPEISEYERERQEKIAKNQALLRSLALEASSTGLAPTATTTSSANTSRSRNARRSGRHSTTGPDGQNQDQGLGRSDDAYRADRKRDRKAKEGVKRYVEESLSLPRRTSSRLRGIVADSEVAKRKAEEENVALAEAERAKRRRVSGDLRLGDVIVSNMRKGGGGIVSGAAMKGWDGVGLSGVLGPARPNERTYFDGLENGDGGEHGTVTDKGLRALREKMGGLRLWDGFEPNRIKITPERIYSLGFHPTPEKPLVFAGDKLGNLGLCDCSQTSASSPSPSIVKPDPEGEDDDSKSKKKTIKNESDEGDDAMNDEEDYEEAEPAITTFKIHTRTISAFKFAPTDSNMLYSASYDSSIRKLDLAKGVSVEIYATGDDEPVTAIDMAPNDPNTMYFTTIEGRFGIYDMRTPSPTASLSPSSKNNNKTKIGATLDTTSSGGSLRESLSLSDKKIGGFSLHPQHPHFVATASLDRMVKVWDLRKINGRDDWRLPVLLGEHESRLSVSHASFNGVGQVSTASYDDTIKIYDFWGKNGDGGGGAGEWKVGASLSGQRMEPSVIVPHNNQTGRWVTILRAQWQESPPATPSGKKTEKGMSTVQRFCIGNMNRFVDVYTADGHQIAQLGDDSGEGRITAVPAVAKFHPSVDWVAAGTASGKLCLWM